MWNLWMTQKTPNCKYGRDSFSFLSLMKFVLHVHFCIRTMWRLINGDETCMTLKAIQENTMPSMGQLGRKCTSMAGQLSVGSKNHLGPKIISETPHYHFLSVHWAVDWVGWNLTNSQFWVDSHLLVAVLYSIRRLYITPQTLHSQCSTRCGI